MAAAGVVLAAITGLVGCKKAQYSKKARAALSGPVPVEMMATSSKSAEEDTI